MLLAFAISQVASSQGTPLDHAHAHNDYEHARPLLGALERGFSSVEADVHLVDGQLLVAHSRDSVDATRTLESLYLAPLRAYVQAHGGRAYAGRQPFTLLIDVKSDSERSYVALDSLLRRYADLFTIFAGGDVVDGPVVAIVSGERAIRTMQRAHVRFASVDGRIADLSANPRLPRAVMPLISDSWDRITKWKGSGPTPPNVRPDVERVVAQAHQHGQRVRFWGTPDNDIVWRLLLDAKVDLIGADDLDALRAFFVREAR